MRCQHLSALTVQYPHISNMVSTVWCTNSKTMFFNTMTLWSCCQHYINNRTVLSRKGIGMYSQDKTFIVNIYSPLESIWMYCSHTQASQEQECIVCYTTSRNVLSTLTVQYSDSWNMFLQLIQRQRQYFEVANMKCHCLVKCLVRLRSLSMCFLILVCFSFEICRYNWRRALSHNILILRLFCLFLLQSKKTFSHFTNIYLHNYNHNVNTDNQNYLLAHFRHSNDFNISDKCTKMCHINFLYLFETSSHKMSHTNFTRQVTAVILSHFSYSGT